MMRYQIISGLNFNKALEVVPFAKTVQLTDSNLQSSNQLFYIEDLNGSEKKIKCVEGGKYLSSYKQRGIELSQSADTDHQRWTFIQAEEGGYYIKNKANKKVFDVDRFNLYNGTPIIAYYKFHGLSNQRFYLKEV